MPTSHQSITFDVQDCKVYPLTSDSGASPVYGSGVDVYGIFSASLDPNLVSASLKGDGKVIAQRSKIDKFMSSLTYGKLDLDVLEVILGNAPTDQEGSATLRYRANQELPHFGLALYFSDVDDDVGCVHLYVYKVKMTGGTIVTPASDSFAQPTLDVEGIGLRCPGEIYTDAVWDITFFDVDTPLPATLAA